MKLQIPRRDQPAIAALLSVPVVRLEALLHALESNPKLMGLGPLGRLLSQHSDGPQADLILRMLLTLATIRRQHTTDISTVLDAIRAAVLRVADLAPQVSALDERRALIASIVTNRSFVYTEKANDLMAAHACVVVESRIITDIRPVFDEETETPMLGIITHLLRLNVLTDGPEGDLKSICVTLDEADLKILSSQVDRALKKVEAIRRSSISESMHFGLLVAGAPGSTGDE